jgi:predicted ester cyclase
MSDSPQIELNRALVKRFVDEWLNKRSREALAEIAHPEFAYHWGPLGEGKGADGLAAMEDSIRAAFPDLYVDPAFSVADETYVVNRSVVTGTHEGEWFGMEPTGRRATWTAVEIYRIQDDLIAEQWLNEDWAGVLQQVGRLDWFGRR